MESWNDGMKTPDHELRTPNTELTAAYRRKTPIRAILALIFHDDELELSSKNYGPTTKNSRQ
jgi:hypothetical protein